MNSWFYALAHGLPQGINFFLLPVYTRYLTPEEFGIFSFTSAVLVFLPILSSLSLNAYFLRHYRTAETDRERKTLVGTISITLTFSALTVAALGFFLLPIIFQRLDISVDFEPYMRLALMIGVIDVIAIIPQNYLRVTENAKAFFALVSVRIVMVAGLTVYLLVVEDFGLLSRYYGLLSANSVLLIFYIGLIWRVSHFNFSLKFLSKGIGFSYPLAISALLFSLVSVADRFVLERYSALSELGIYAIAVAISGALTITVSSLYKAFEPQIYSLASDVKLNDFTVGVKQTMLTVTIIVAIPLVSLVNELLSLLVSPEFYRAADVIPILVGTEMLKGLAVPVVIHLLTSNQTKFQPVITGFSGLVMVVTSLYLVPLWGVVGVAWATLIAAAAYLTGNVIYSETKTAVTWAIPRDVVMVGGAVGAGYLIQSLNFEYALLGGAVKLTLAITAVAVYMTFNRKLAPKGDSSTPTGTDSSL